MLYSVNRKVQLTILFNNLLFSIGVRDVHGAIFLESIISSCNPIGIISRDPQGGITLHLTATGIEEIVILADLCEALYPHQIIIVIGSSTTCDKAGFDQPAVFIKRKVAVAGSNQIIEAGNPYGGIDSQNAIAICIVVFAIQLV